MEIPDGKTRSSYYSVNFLPKSYKDGSTSGLGDGTQYPGYITYWSQTVINNEYAIASNFTMNLLWYFNSAQDSINITCTITATAATTMTTPVLQLALVEETITFTTAPGSNGEKEFRNICRVMVPSATGTTLPTSWTNGQTQTYTFKQKLPTNIYKKTEVNVVGFIQDNSNKNVKQAVRGTKTMVGVNDYQNDKMVQIYPNPTNDIFTINFTEKNINNINIEVYNITGKCIKKISANEISNTMNIDISNEDAGIYIVHFKSPTETFTRKISLIK